MIKMVIFLVFLVVACWLVSRPIRPRMENTIIKVDTNPVLFRAIGAEPSLESDAWVYADNGGLLEKVATVHIDTGGRKTFIVSDTDLGRLFYEYIAPDDGLKVNVMRFWPDGLRHFRY